MAPPMPDKHPVNTTPAYISALTNLDDGLLIEDKNVALVDVF
jgi:hypothetical protein